MDSQGSSSGVSSIEGTPESAKEIKQIDKISVHKICSGQVILGLGSAVKELVENALDAKATLIEVKLKDSGLESVEVSDNGIGVEKDNFMGLTAKYHTSKIRDFTDLEHVATFGFRGEALSSICALADMVIITRHKTAACGTRLDFDHRGDITGELPCPRHVGTTVQLKNLFATLPVRKAEFRRNVKKEFTRMCTILQSYCLSATGVRIHCTNTTAKGAKTTVFHTEGGADVLQNIRNVFGTKQATDLVRIKPPLERDDQFSQETFLELDLDEVRTEDLEKLNVTQFTITGWISSCAHGAGRSSRDRQFIYINSRPCEMKKILQTINDVYHKYNIHQSPFIYLDIRMESSRVDVNVTPDKRQLFIGNENILLLALKISLLRTFNECASIYKIEKPTKVPQKIPNEPDLFPSSQAQFSQKLSQWKATGSTDDKWSGKKTKRKVEDEISARKSKMQKIQAFLETPDVSKKTRISCGGSTARREIAFEDVTPERIVPEKFQDVLGTKKIPEIPEEIKRFLNDPGNKETVEGPAGKKILKAPEILDDPNINKILEASEFKKIQDITEKNKFPDVPHTNRIQDIKKVQNFPEIKKYLEDPKVQKHPEINGNSGNIQQSSKNIPPGTSTQIMKLSEVLVDDIIDVDSVVNSYSSRAKIRHMVNKIKISIEEIRQKSQHEAKAMAERSGHALRRLKFKAKLDPNVTEVAEEELSREIDKTSFGKMKVIGQFNKSFIIARLDDDLFIVDQHATDEKYNFEQLQATEKIHAQPLVIPQPLELSAVKELQLMDNMDVFQRNGFHFHVNMEAPMTKRIKLTKKPQSRNWDFGIEDIEELLFMLQDAPTGTTCRPTRVRAMFASRACRKSVMFGDALKRSDMRRLLDHMGEIKHPWHCPHGRPTMRHLINLRMLKN